MNRIWSGGAFLLPKENIDLKKYAVIACDQYTSEKEKWEAADAFVSNAPSTLRMILPECWLNETQTRVPQIQRAMKDYLARGVLTQKVRDGFVLTERSTPSGARWGLVITVDLEAYDYSRSSVSPIRPTEGTIVERIPPRLHVRRGAPIELSHVMMLLDDPQDMVIGRARDMLSGLPLLYDTDLMMSGGHLRGWAVEGEALKKTGDALDSLLDSKRPGDIFFAVGDGNHSLATAKAYWEELKKSLPKEALKDHPARWASVELVNIYCPALTFEPIHRVVFHTDADRVLDCLAAASPVPCAADPDVILVTGDGDKPLRFEKPLHPLPVGTVQAALDQRGGFEIDYVHGEDAVRALSSRPGTVGILVPPIPKDSFFDAVRPGPLPRKTFSMGEANEKRFYMEARLITGEKA